MSDTDDGFDEEAVREELREKYADEDRGETERMSELLLQGATMTNQHCDRCGNPIFRYEGRAFCPNCQQPAEQRATGQQSTDEQQPTGQQSGDGQQPAAGREPTEHATTRDASDRPRRDTPAEPTTDAAAQPPQADRSPRQPAADRPASDQPAPSSEAADALESSIGALARRAAGSDDPRTAREYLEAAREAAEALAALRRNA